MLAWGRVIFQRLWGMKERMKEGKKLTATIPAVGGAGQLNCPDAKEDGENEGLGVHDRLLRLPMREG